MQIEMHISEEAEIKSIIKAVSKSFYGYLKENKALCYVDGVLQTFTYRASVGSQLRIIYPPLKQTGFPSSEGLDILFQNSNFWVIRKQCKLLTIPSRKNPYDSVYNRLLYWKNDEETIHFINRLDDLASGLLLVAKNQYYAALLSRVKIEKSYYVKTLNKLSSDVGVISSPIRKMDKGYEIDALGKQAITEFDYLGQIGVYYNYKVNLITGRTNQIRLHFSSVGSPLFADPKYGFAEEGDLGLCCREMRFIDPINKEAYDFEY